MKFIEVHQILIGEPKARKKVINCDYIAMVLPIDESDDGCGAELLFNDNTNKLTPMEVVESYTDIKSKLCLTK